MPEILPFMPIVLMRFVSLEQFLFRLYAHDSITPGSSIVLLLLQCRHASSIKPLRAKNEEFVALIQQKNDSIKQ